MAKEIPVERPKELDEMVNAFDRTAVYIDNHLQEVRFGIFGLAAVGTILTIRGLRVFTRFQRAKDLPSSYYKKNVTLHGIVRRVDPESRTLFIEHEPKMSLWQRKITNDSLLPVSMGGVRMTALGYQWLDLTMRNKRVSITLLSVSPNNEAECIVNSIEGILNKRCLNYEAVKLGFGQVANMDKRLSKNSMYAKFYRKLLQMESKALSDRNGLWSTTPTAKPSLVVMSKVWIFLNSLMQLVPKLKSMLRLRATPAVIHSKQ